MATREDIIQALELTVPEGKRTTSLFAEGEWDAKRDSGWTPRQVYSHLAATAKIVPQLGAGLANASEDTDIAGGMDINAMNAGAVAQMDGMEPGQIMQAFETNYAELIDYVKNLPEEQLQAKRRFLSDSVPVSDILASSIGLHGIHHVYEAFSRFGG
ncbi:MAG: maleylpyruvate isomerase N-terminal domain-containing protein [Chloroflexi bacterium]|nr:maleylpyruvate isomerase N-terminal domain-containing protein [Chloroflexota bacterium]